MAPPAFETLSETQLDHLSGELLPPRMLMSVVIPPATGTSRPGTGTVFACQETDDGGTPGLLRTGLLSSPPHTNLACIPATGHGPETLFACQESEDGATDGLLGLGVLATPSHSSHVCVPASDPGLAHLYACQSSDESGTDGLLGLGLLATPSHSSEVCVPAAVQIPDVAEIPNGVQAADAG